MSPTRLPAPRRAPRRRRPLGPTAGALAGLLLAACTRTIPAQPLPPDPRPDATVFSAACGGAALTVRALPPLAAPPGHFWTGPVGPRRVSLGMDGRRLVGSTFDPASSRTTPLPRGGPRRTRADAVPIVAGERLLFADGFSPAPVIFDPAANRWLDARPGAPDPSVPLRVVTSGERWVAWPAPREAERPAEARLLELRTGRWTPLPAEGAPSARAYPSVVACGDTIFVWGGVAGPSLLADGATLDLGTATWTALPSDGRPAPRYRAFAGCRGGEVVVFGGGAVAGSLSTDAARFDLASRRWTAVEAPRAPRFLAEGWTQEPGAFLDGDRLVAHGRLANEVVAAALDLRAGEWRDLPELRISADRAEPFDGAVAFVGTCEEPLAAAAAPASPRASRAELLPCAALLRADGPGPCVWPLPRLPPFDPPPGALPFRYGEAFASGAGVVVRGLTWSLPDPHPCPPGAPCLPRRIRVGGSDAAAELRWR